jgi:hypothetical protein
MVDLKKTFKRKKTEYERSLEPKSLAPSSITKEFKFTAFFAVFILGGLGVLFYMAQTFVMSETEFVFLAVMVFMILIAGLAGISAYWYLSAVKTPLFDREFGFSGGLRVRHEIYIEKQNVRQLITKDDKIQDRDGLIERLTKFIPDPKELEAVKNCLPDDTHDFPANLTYFYHPNIPIEGWDKQRHTRPIFKSHAVFHSLPEPEQFIFAQGHDNWYGSIYFNHPLSESDNVKVIAWILDPFTGDPMPLCILVHSSVVYDEEEEPAKIDVKLVEALSTVLVKQHSIIEAFRRDNNEKEMLLAQKFHDDVNTIDYGHNIAETDINFFKGVMKFVSKGFWSKLGNIGKVIVTITIVAGLVLIVWLVLSWLGYARLPW